MSDRVLLIDGHPDPRSERLCHEIAKAYAKGARAGGAEVRVLALAGQKLAFLDGADEFTTAPTDPFILGARDSIEWSTHLVLIFPLWLGSAPAALKAFFEQVSRASFVADIDAKGWRPRFRGRSARIIVTMGMPAFVFRTLFGGHGVGAWRKGILGFAGFGPIRETLFGAIGAVSREEIARRLAKVERLGRKRI